MTCSAPRVMFIGGLDSSGAAGLTADLRAAAGFGVDAASVATAVTVQSTQACRAMHAVDADVIAAQLTAAGADVIPTVVKTGMFCHAAQVRAVADRIKAWRRGGQIVELIVDPVLGSSSGARFVDAEALSALNDELLPLAALVTPNAFERERLLYDRAALTLHKGGHLDLMATGVRDTLTIDGRTWHLSTTRRSGDWRGTGCSLAAAMAAARVVGAVRQDTWLDAAIAARTWLQAALRRSTLPSRGPGRIMPTHWQDTTAADVPDLYDTPSTAACFPTLHHSLGVYPVVERTTQMRQMLDAGVRTLQLRIKDLTGSALRQELQIAVTMARVASAQLFINDYWREAIELGAYGVHLGQEDLDDADLDAIRASGLRLGISTHGHAEAARAKTLKPSYLALGPIRPTTCKSMRFGPQGFERVAEWRRLYDAPLCAIGGLTHDDLVPLRALGADGVAVISAILKAADPAAAARAWVATWGSHDVALRRPGVSGTQNGRSP